MEKDRKEQIYKLLINNIQDSYLITDNSYIIKQWLCGSEILFNLTEAVAKGKFLFKVLKVKKDILEDSHPNDIFELSLSKNNTVYIKLINKNILKDSILWIFQDYSQQKKLENYLDNYHDSIQNALENELIEKKMIISGYTEQIKFLKSKLQGSQKIEVFDNFIRNLLHELKTPISVVLSYLAYLQDELKDYSGFFKSTDSNISIDDNAITGSLLSDIDVMLENAEMAIKYVESIRTFSKDQKRQEKRKFELVEYFNFIILFMKPQWGRKNFEVRINAPEKIILNSSPGAFYQILTNLVNNSMIHSFSDKDHEKGYIDIHLKKEENALILDYRNNGKWIKEEVLPKIFEPYFTTTSKKGGTGIGLNLIHTIVENELKGEISCKNLKQGGVQFLITIPI